MAYVSNALQEIKISTSNMFLRNRIQKQGKAVKATQPVCQTMLIGTVFIEPTIRQVHYFIDGCSHECLNQANIIVQVQQDDTNILKEKDHELPLN